MTVEVDEARLDDAAAIEAGDPAGMLRAIATSAAQVRRSATAARESGLDAVAAAGRPRSLVVAGMGGSGIAGDVLAAVAGASCPVPVVVHRGYGLPGWVGPADVVVAVSCSGATAETLSATDEAIRRGASIVGVGAVGSPLAERCEQARSPFVPVTMEVGPRATLWALATPLLVLAADLGLVDLGADGAELEAAATRLEALAASCRPDRDTFVNPAKELAVTLVGTLPMLWGAGPVGPVATQRMAAQLAENAKYPALWSALPEGHHNQIVVLDGGYAATAADDLFRDRVEPGGSTTPRLVLLHDDDGTEVTARRVAASRAVAEARGVPVTELPAEGEGPLERLASLVGLVDFATAYLAIAQGIDPAPVAVIDEMKAYLRDP